MAVDPAQHNKATELQLWPLFGYALTAGWGNCGGGFTILIMGYVYEGLRSAGLSRDQAWRNAFYFPGAIVLVVAAALYACSDER